MNTVSNESILLKLFLFFKWLNIIKQKVKYALRSILNFENIVPQKTWG